MRVVPVSMAACGELCRIQREFGIHIWYIGTESESEHRRPTNEIESFWTVIPCTATLQ
jgi:hypothetical protein